ncbi:gluconate 2-dehydrogenase subunit 3 family protein [Mycobacterium sp. DL440]|uniref:gluconate 2-dehydrogenase subunit 3 family protein n=1 Tax=Mycobacterium sp. DL440 TaxID=2675523 RepID=UPI001422FD6C|nr:gluconate 2-dehydrogenase subunit 3 family protein [Mycobacterium sp. DL440]
MVTETSTAHAVTPQNRGRYRGFDVLDQAHQWDPATTEVVAARLHPPESPPFFSPDEAAVAAALLDLLLAQDSEPKVPVLPLIETRLATGETDGWHYDDMAPDGQAWRASLAGLDDDARRHYGIGYADLSRARQARLLTDVQDLGERGDTWRDWSAGHVWSLWTRYACTAFYSHPWAWNEMGFSGPAYPRGYLNLGVNAREHFEIADRDDTDPVGFADRVERARHADDDLPDRGPHA